MSQQLSNPDPVFENVLVDIDDLPRLEDLSYSAIDSRYAYVIYGIVTIVFVILLAAVAIGSGVLFGLFHWVTYVLFLSWFCLFLLGLWFGQFSSTRMKYLLRSHDISYQEGVWFRSWTTVPFNRIQHCEVARGVLDNLFGLSELRIYTAGGSSSDLTVPGLRPEVAERLKEAIIRKIAYADEEE